MQQMKSKSKIENQKRIVIKSYKAKNLQHFDTISTPIPIYHYVIIIQSLIL